MNPKKPRSERSAPLDDPLISLLATSAQHQRHLCDIRCLHGRADRDRDIQQHHELPDENVIHIKIVLATAFMAVAHKVIVLEYKEVSSDYAFATAALMLALAVAYWLAVVKNPSIESHGEL